VDLEPHVFDDVAGDDGGALRGGEIGAVEADEFEKRVARVAVVVSEHVIGERGGGAEVTFVAQRGAELGEAEGPDHRDAVGLGVGGKRIREMGDAVVGRAERDERGVGGASGERGDGLITGGEVEFGEAVDGEGVDVDAFVATKDAAVLREEEGPRLGRVLPAVADAEIGDVAREAEPRGVAAVQAVETAKNPDGAPLAPEPFVGAEDFPVVADAGVEAAVVVDGVAYPEMQDVVEEVRAEPRGEGGAVAGAEGGESGEAG
jgi:hypothetical protein